MTTGKKEQLTKECKNCKSLKIEFFLNVENVFKNNPGAERSVEK